MLVEVQPHTELDEQLDAEDNQTLQRIGKGTNLAHHSLLAAHSSLFSKFAVVLRQEIIFIS